MRALDPLVTVTFHLPMATTPTNEFIAATRALDHLYTKYPSETGDAPGGYAPRRDDQGELEVVRRYAWSQEKGGVVLKQEMRFSVTIPGSIDDPDVRARINVTRDRIDAIYSAAGAPQDEILCTLQQLHRLNPRD